jgi:hypothetical protein
MQRNQCSPVMRGIVVAAVAIGCSAWLEGRAAGQPLPYTFKKITDSVATPGLGGVQCVGMNDLGTVAVQLSSNQLFRGRDAASLTLVAPSAFSQCPSINDNDEIAYTTGGPVGSTVLVKDAAGSITTLASSTTAPALYSPTTFLPSLNGAGRAVYMARDGGLGQPLKIAIAPTGTIVASDPPLTIVSPASMNDADVVAFAASASGTAGLYRGSAVPLLVSGDSISGGTILFSALQRPSVNNGGLMAFIGRLDIGGVTGIYGVYTTDGTSVSLVGTSPVDRFSLNDAGAVVYRRTLSGGAGSGLYLGRPGLIDQEVIGQGDPLDGSTVADTFIWHESLNDLGQVAFWAFLADGRQGIYVATPKWLNALSFASKVPACGPIAAKVTLTTAAPPGGLSVDLTSLNPSASVPLHVVVPAGKKSASFQIVPTPVLATAVGDIEATYGAQLVERVLRVRPISVKSVALAPNPVVGGAPVLGAVTLDCNAQPADLTVALSSTRPSAAAPATASIVVPQGTDSKTFNVTTAPVVAPTSATIKASALGTTKSKKLVVNP